MRKWLLLLCIVISCTAAKLNDEVAALVNREVISTEELRNNIAFFTQLAPMQRGRELVETHLNLLIDKKLFAQEGRRQGFDKKPAVQQVVDWTERDQMIKALYHKEVRSTIEVTEAQIRAAFMRGRERLHLRHLFARSEAEAVHLKAQLDAGIPFEQIAASTFRDSTLRGNGGDLGYVGYEDIDERLAEAAFDLPLHQVSAPVRSKWGYHILRVDDRRQQIFTTAEDYAQQRDGIARDLRRGLEKRAADAYVNEMLKSQDVKMINAAFNILGTVIQNIVLTADRMVPNYHPMMGGTEFEMMQRGLAGHENDVLVMFTGGQWTLGDFLSRVKELPLSERPRMDTPGRLRADIGRMVRDELLVQEAKRQNLDQDPIVRATVAKWRDEYTFSALWQSIQDTLQATPVEVERFYEEHRGRYIEPERVRVREIQVSDSLQAVALLQKIRTGADFEQLARQYTQRPDKAELGGDLGWLKRYDFGNVSLKALELQPGQVGGPVRVPQGFAIVRNEGYQSSRPATLEEAMRSAQKDAREFKSDQLYASMAAELRRKARIVRHEKVLAQLSIEFAKPESPINLMAAPMPQ